MKVKKHKRHRKVVCFYSACFGFREPYKVLCDGTFIHHLLLHRLTPINDAVARLLGARVLPFTTRCIIGELRSLGESHHQALEAAQKLMMARCDHEKRINAMTCIESVVGEAKSEHRFVATQDADMRKRFQEIYLVNLDAKEHTFVSPISLKTELCSSLLMIRRENATYQKYYGSPDFCENDLELC